MNKLQLWEIYVAANPQFAGEGTVTLTRSGFRKLFDQTWEMASRHSEETSRAADPAPDASLVDQIFGRNSR